MNYKRITQKIGMSLLSLSLVQPVFAKEQAIAAADDVITTQVIERIGIAQSPTQNDIVVETQYGVTSLYGNVETEEQAIKLVEMVQSVKNVKDVNIDNLHITSKEQPFADSVITAKVKTLFLREKLFGNKEVSAWNIKVETKNNNVYLSGKVTNQEEVKNAMTIAKSVKGVKHVQSQVEVAKS